MKGQHHAKLLVINFDSPSAMISADFIRDARNEIEEVFGEDVTAFILLYRSLVNIEEEP